MWIDPAPSPQLWRLHRAFLSPGQFRFLCRSTDLGATPWLEARSHCRKSFAPPESFFPAALLLWDGRTGAPRHLPAKVPAPPRSPSRLNTQFVALRLVRGLPFTNGPAFGQAGSVTA